jgi:hypothetical protein
MVGTRRVHRVAGDVPPVPFQGSSHAGQGPAGADELAEGVDLAAGLLPQLLARAVLVGAGVALEQELVGAKGAPLRREGGGDLLDAGEILARDVTALGAGHLVDEHHLGPESPHHGDPLVGVAPRDHGDERMAGHGTHDGEARTGVAAGELDHRLARPQPAVGGGVLDHA